VPFDLTAAGTSLTAAGLAAALGDAPAAAVLVDPPPAEADELLLLELLPHAASAVAHKTATARDILPRVVIMTLL
jgi:hypothetical protein